ncbi:MAG: hypothetical protein EP336_10400 [Rhodobacteraceae bacterium]|nr:MAG: hypothetical protein EP336_10400 [Paracoccaceae bacterium]
MMHDRKKVIQRFIRRALRRVTPRATDLQEKPILRLPKDYIAAAQSLSAPLVMKETRTLEKIRQGENFEGVHPQIVDFYRAFQKELKRRNIPFYAFEFKRSLQRQARLLKAGVTKARPGQSPHQYGLAVDLVSVTDHWGLTKKQWAVIGAIGKEVARKRGCDIEWGGDWSFYDPAHWQLANWRSWEEFRKEAGTPWPVCETADQCRNYFGRFKKWLKGHAVDYSGALDL